VPAARPAPLHAPARHVPPAQQVPRPHIQRTKAHRAAPGQARGFCYPLDGRTELKVHSLLPVPRCRAFAKGDLEGPPNHDDDNDNAEPRTAEATFIPGHPLLNARVAHLHARLPHDEHAQVFMPSTRLFLFQMDASLPPHKASSEPSDLPPLTRRDLESFQINLNARMGAIDGCKYQIHEMERKLNQLVELVNLYVNVSFAFIIVYNVGSFIFSHVKVGWA